MLTHAAIAMIQDHGNFAAQTCDGLLATSTVVDLSLDDDRIFEEPMLFEIDPDGRVCPDAVLAWLGY